jgi:hypothetical protein
MTSEKARDPVRNFRLTAAEVADLDAIAAHHTAETGVPHTRTDVVRFLIRKEVDRIRRKEGKS